GTYQIAETQPGGYYQGGNTVGTVNGTTDGTLAAGDVIGSITLGAGQNGAGYNFGEVNPFTEVADAYPYSSSNPLTNVAFNESSTIAGASVDVANGTFGLFYTDEHAMALGVRQVNVKTAKGTTTTNYAISSLATN